MFLEVTRGMATQIRLATPDDAAQIQAIYAPFCAEESLVSFEIVPPTVAEMAGRMTRIAAAYPWLVCDHAGEILGYAYASQHAERAGYRWSVSTAIYIKAGRRGSGVGRALYTTLLDILKLQGFASAYAGTTLPNPASIGLHQAMGYQAVGVYRDVGYLDGQWLDTAWWQVSLRGRMTDPRPPLDVASVLDTPDWHAAIGRGLAHLRIEPSGTTENQDLGT